LEKYFREMIMEKICGNCKYAFDDTFDDDSCFFQCRRHSPMCHFYTKNNTETVWPEVKYTDFCGDWETKII
jgi:hypothetical protein